MYLLSEENLCLKSYVSSSKIGINAFIPMGLCARAGGGGAYTRSNTSVEEKVSLSDGDLYAGGL